MKLRKKIILVAEEVDEGIELLLFSNPDWNLFEAIADYITKSSTGSFTNKSDGQEQRYWDFQSEDYLFTLHLENCCGISILSKEKGEPTKQLIWNIGKKIEKEFNRLIYRVLK